MKLTGPIAVVAALIAAQVVAATTMVTLGKWMCRAIPDAGMGPWMAVGLIGILASLVFLLICMEAPRWLK